MGRAFNSSGSSLQSGAVSSTIFSKSEPMGRSSVTTGASPPVSAAALVPSISVSSRGDPSPESGSSASGMPSLSISGTPPKSPSTPGAGGIGQSRSLTSLGAIDEVLQRLKSASLLKIGSPSGPLVGAP